MKRLIIFDLDGTLLNTIEDLGTAVNHALSLRGIPQHSMEEYINMVGHGVKKLVFDALPEDKKELCEECLQDFMEYYTSHLDVYTKPYDGMAELVSKLNSESYLLAIASNKFQSGTEHLVSHFFPGIDFVAVFGNREGKALKPDPALISEIQELAGKRVSDNEEIQTILVGDSDTDMKTAINAGIPSIAVSWGFRSTEELNAAGAKIIVSTSQELETEISQLFS